MTIADIARLAGVSNSAVSRYFNNGYISEEKREAIRKVIEKTGYRPSLQAQTLRTKKTRTVGVIAPKLASSSLSSVIEGVLMVLNDNDYQMLLSITQNDLEKEIEYLKAFDEKRVDGVILLGSVFTPEHKKIFKAMNVPVVVLGQKFSGQYCVFHDDYHAIYDITNDMIEKGRKKIGYIGVMMQDKAAGQERLAGFKAAMEEAGLEVKSEQCVISKFSFRSGYQKAGELYEVYPDMDGVVCATDEIAVGAMQYFVDRGIDVPGSICVSGHGDTVLTRIAGRDISTVHFSYERSGEIAADMLIELLATGETAMKEVMLGYHLVERGHGEKQVEE